MKIYTVLDETPVNSESRHPEAAQIPPFSFPGEIEIGISPTWSPPYTILLTNGYVQSRTPGTSKAGFVFLISGLMVEDRLLGSAVMSASRLKTIFKFNNLNTPKLIGPSDKIYVASFAASGHEDVTIQLFGDKVT